MPDSRISRDHNGPITVACGGGTNSAAVLTEFARIGQRVDLITFSDTKGEKPETYDFVATLSEWCVQNGLPPVTTVRAESPNPERGFEGLEGMCLRLENLPSKAFGYKSCSQRYKIEPQQKFMNHWKPSLSAWDTCSRCGATRQSHERRAVQMTEREARDEADRLGREADALYEKRKDVFGDDEADLRARMIQKVHALRAREQAIRDWAIIPTRDQIFCTGTDQTFESNKVLQVIGYDAGEPQRAKTYTNDKYDFWYPLIDWGMDRDDCIASIQKAGLPLPGKSSCFFCPSMRKPEVIALAETHPDLFERAVTMERQALAGGKLGVVKGLGRHWSWEELVAAGKQKQSAMPEVSCDTDCACFDGE